jgi:hypothetical protein
MVLLSADTARLTHFIIEKIFLSIEQLSLPADGNTTLQACLVLQGKSME